MKRDTLLRLGAILALVAFVALWIWDPTYSQDAVTQRLLKNLMPRLLGSLAFVLLLLYQDYRVLQAPRLAHLATVLPALAIAVNNLPILALIRGWAWVERGDLLWLFALDAFCIGLFEELAFRGVLLPTLLERFGGTRRGIWLTAVLSSAVFGLFHLVNLLEGAGVGATLLQVGYSFLIGGMCAIVFLRTGNLVYCVLLHAIYDFCGSLIPTLGAGDLWDTPTVVFTAILGVAVTAWMLWQLYRTEPQDLPIYRTKPKGDTYHEHETN